MGGDRRSMARRSCTVDQAVRYSEMNVDLDVRDVVSTIRVPVLVMHAKGDVDVPGDPRTLAGRAHR